MEAILLLRSDDGAMMAMEFVPTDLTFELRQDWPSRYYMGPLEEHLTIRGTILRRFVVDDETWIPERPKELGDGRHAIEPPPPT